MATRKKPTPRPVNTKYIRVRSRPGPNGYEYVPTKEGIEEAYRHARRGGTVRELARLFRMADRTLMQWCDPNDTMGDEKFVDAWNNGRYEYLSDLREKQLGLAETNGAVAIHLGKHELEQHDRPQEVNHLHRVVGTLPDYDRTSDDWKKQFAPQPVVDAGQLIAQEIEEAEYEDVADEDDEAK